MEELLKTTRTVQRTVTALSVVMITFLYPLQSRAPFERAYDESYELTHILIDLRSKLETIEGDARHDLLNDIELLLGERNSSLSDSSGAWRFWDDPEGYVFLEVGHWAREEDSLRFTDILSRWKSDTLAVYEYDRDDLKKTLSSPLAEDNETYAFLETRRKHDEGGVSLELTLRAGYDGKVEKLSLPLTNTEKPFNVRGFFEEHSKSALVIVDGELCPSLEKMDRKVRDVPIDEAQANLRALLPENPDEVTVLGITVGVLGAALFTPAILMGLLLYLAAHLRHIIKMTQALSSTERREALRFPWTPIYEGWLSRTVEVVSLGILPVVAVGIVVLNLPTSIGSNWFLRGVAYVEFLMTVVLAVLVITWSWSAGRSMRLSNEGTWEKELLESRGEDRVL